MRNIKEKMRLASPHIQPWIRANTTSYSEHLVTLNPVNFKSNILFSEFTTANISQPLLLVPDSTPKIFFKLGGNYRADFIGHSTQSRELTLVGNTDYFCVEFYSLFGTKGWRGQDVAFQPLQIPLIEVLKNSEELIDLISKGSSFEERVTQFEIYYLNKIVSADYSVELAEYTASLLYLSYSMKDLERFLGYGRRRIETNFKDFLGITPMRYKNTFRFQKSLKLLLTNQRFNNSEIATEAGYFDEPHFIRDFSASMNKTPNQFRKEIAQYDYKFQGIN